jgi:hypothetical protein
MAQQRERWAIERSGEPEPMEPNRAPQDGVDMLSVGPRRSETAELASRSHVTLEGRNKPQRGSYEKIYLRCCLHWPRQRQAHKLPNGHRRVRRGKADRLLRS